MPMLSILDAQASALPLTCHYASTSALRSKDQLSISAMKYSSLSNSSRHPSSYGVPIIPTSQTRCDSPSGLQTHEVDDVYPVIGDGTGGQDNIPERDMKTFTLERSLISEAAIIYSTSTLSRTIGCSDSVYESPTDTFPASCSTYEVLTPLPSDSAFSTYPSTLGHSFRNRNKYYYAPSACSPQPGTSAEENSSTSRDSCITDITIADFPLPPPCVSGLPSDCRAGLSDNESSVT